MPYAPSRRGAPLATALRALLGPRLFGRRRLSRCRRSGSWRCRRGRLRCFVALAVGNLEATATFSFRLPLLFEFFYELAQRRLLLRRRQLRFDRRFSLLERLLAAWRDRLHLEDVVAKRRLHRAREDVLLSREDRRVERLLLP